MPDGRPIDLAFTDWVDAPASPSHPGASDFNRLQFDVGFLANPPSCRLSRSDTQLMPSTFTPAGMYWNVKAWATDPAMVAGGVGTSGAYTDRILLPYVGEWEADVIVRSQFNNAQLNSQIWLNRVTSDNTQTPIDSDVRDCTYPTPNVMRIRAHFLISAAHVAAGAGVRVEYAQASGGAASIVASTGVNAYPSFYVRWVGTGGLF